MALKDLVLPSPDDPDVLQVLAELDGVTPETTEAEIRMMARRIVCAIRYHLTQKSDDDGED
jgi:hypothetical protein